MKKKLIDYQGQKLSIYEIAQLNGVNAKVLAIKYNAMGDINEAIKNLQEVQLGPREYVDFFGQKMSINQIAHLYGVNRSILARVYKLTSDIDEAVSICVSEDIVGGELYKEKLEFRKKTVSIDKLTNVNRNLFPETSLKSNDHTLLNNSIDTIELVENKLLAVDIKKTMKTIPSREREVLRLRFGLDGSNSLVYEEIGKIMGVCKERIRQIEAKALRRLRHPNRSQNLVSYVKE